MPFHIESDEAPVSIRWAFVNDPAGAHRGDDFFRNDVGTDRLTLGTGRPAGFSDRSSASA